MCESLSEIPTTRIEKERKSSIHAITTIQHTENTQSSLLIANKKIMQCYLFLISDHKG